MTKKLTLRDYDCVRDMIEELLYLNGITEYGFEGLEGDTVYVVGTNNIVKLGEKAGTLKHRRYSTDENGELLYSYTKDIVATDSYLNASYYELEAMEKLVGEKLTGEYASVYSLLD